MQNFVNIIPFNLLDCILVLTIFGAMISGLRNGFGREFITFAIWGAVAGFTGMIVIDAIPNGGLTQPLAIKLLKQLGIVFAATYVVIWVIDFIYKRMVSEHGVKFEPTPASRLLGIAFGAIKVCLVLVIGHFTYISQSHETTPYLPEIAESSFIVKRVSNTSNDIYNYVTDKGWMDYEKTTYYGRIENNNKNPINLSGLISRIN